MRFSDGVNGVVETTVMTRRVTVTSGGQRLAAYVPIHRTLVLMTIEIHLESQNTSCSSVPSVPRSEKVEYRQRRSLPKYKVPSDSVFMLEYRYK